MEEVASEGSRVYEPIHREVVNFHSLLDHLADISIPSLCLYSVFIVLMALRWLNSLGLLNFYLLLRSINHLDTRLANGCEINGSVISPAVELSLSKARLSQIELRMFRGKCRGWGKGVKSSIFILPWSTLCLRQNLGHPLEIFPPKGLANMPCPGGSIGWSVIPHIKSLQVQFPVRAHT